jgi:hypothetical protein
MTKWFLAAAGLFVGAMVVTQWPEIERYRRMRAM